MALTAAVSLLFGGAAGAGSALLLTGRAEPNASPTVGSEDPTGDAEPTAEPAGRKSAEPSPATSDKPGDVSAVASAVLPSTVTIHVRSGTNRSAGSGVILSKDGHILTNNHVVEAGASGAQVEVILAGGARVRAQIVGRSPGYDLAVIKIPAGEHLTPAVIGDSSQVRTGQPAIAVGSPLGLGGSVTSGIVSSLDRPVRVGDDNNAEAAVAYINGIQTDAAINPGNSGGPLVDAEGKVIGINSAILTLGDQQQQSGSIGVGFAIPINQAITIANELKANGKAQYPVIGAQVRDTPDESGAELIEITGGGPAAAAGLRAGDKVVAVAGRAVYDSTELIVQIRTHRPGEKISIDYIRGGKEASVDVTLEGRVG
ncbi:S1C family serine protease [Enemella sp. A6]|uniref:S1C family serine protease n=1 Tax=Enemella sp. A6 TaxID=3440152 RepID=UPI003EC03D0B